MYLLLLRTIGYGNVIKTWMYHVLRVLVVHMCCESEALMHMC
jgi:hypothetical protein